jgi:serine/threonine protein kinase
MPEDPAAISSASNTTKADLSRDSVAAETPSSTGASGDRDILLNVIAEVITRRARGERVSSEEVIASHPELMPDLRDDLLSLDEIHRVVVQDQAQFSANGLADGMPASPRGELIALKDSVSERSQDARLRIHGYCIEREISSGGQATVFRAMQEKTGRTVAVKIMHGGPFAGSRGRKRFDRESIILARLNHPNVVGILDRGRTADGSFFLVMDFIEGRGLDAFVEELGTDTTAIIRTFIKIANALDDAHRHGVVHRDLKPMNILVDTRSEPHILDFGMARLQADSDQAADGATDQTTLTRTGQVLGSLPWSSPEQVCASSDTIDARSDVYALGVMLFAALAGEFPYPVKGIPSAVTQHITNTPPASLTRLAQRHGITVNRCLEQIVLKALRKLPSQRYESAGLLSRDLESWLSGKTLPLQRRVSYLRLAKTFAVIAGLSLLLCNGPSVINPPPSFVISLGMRFARITRGTTSLGTLANGPSEVDPPGIGFLSVKQDFYMSATDVTQRQYLRVIGWLPSRPTAIGVDVPVQFVTWSEATAFCEALSRRYHRKYRLPTSAEWKFAFYSGQSTSLTGNQLGTVAWYADNAGLCVQAVAQKLPDHWGLYDMIGDVRQWCTDPPGSSSTSISRNNAIGKSAQLVEGTDYLSPASACLRPSRLEMECPPETSLPTIGFRVVCESADPN